jgi:hypothetical protein
MLHCNINLAWQYSYALQLLEPSRIVEFDGGGISGKWLQRADKIT